MLKIKQKRTASTGKFAVTLGAAVLTLGGIYLLALVAAPTVAPLVAMKPINVTTLPTPVVTENRIIIPKLGINIVYGQGSQALDRGAEWRLPERGDPVTGGNFIIAAHRFSIQPTPKSTIEKSPFYNIDKLTLGDKIVIDYNGVRYGYEIDSINTVKPTQTEVEAPSDAPKLTIYSCELDGADVGRIVLTAKPLGKVALEA